MLKWTGEKEGFFEASMRQGNVLLSMSVCVCAFERMVLIGMGTCNNLMVLCCNGINSLVVVFFRAWACPKWWAFFLFGPRYLVAPFFLNCVYRCSPEKKKAITAAVQHKKGQWVSWIEYKQIIRFYIRGLLIDHHTSFYFRDVWLDDEVPNVEVSKIDRLNRFMANRTETAWDFMKCNTSKLSMNLI